MSDPFDQFERTMRRAMRRARVPFWRRASTLTVIGLGIASAGALAATGVLETGSPVVEPTPTPTPTTGAGVTRGDATILPLRVADPAGGPPWGLRVFRTSRGTACVQIGRVYKGRLGVLAPPGRKPSTKVVFRELGPQPGTSSVLCGGVVRNGRPVIRGLRRVELDGGNGDAHFCNGAGGTLQPCPITNARIVRYGLLGPLARSVRFVDGAGTVRATAKTSTGGAYLFVVPVAAQPFRDAAQRERRYAEVERAMYRRLRAQGLSQSEAFRRAASAARRQLGGRTRVAAPRQPRDHVIATFAGGRRLRVAGPGRTKAALPGVTRRRQSAARVRARLSVAKRGRGDRVRFVLTFRAPVAITRADQHYTLTMRGRTAASCRLAMPGGGQSTTRDIAQGEAVRFVVEPRRFNVDGRRGRWCRGPFVARVGYSTGATGFAGRLVAAYRFTVR